MADDEDEETPEEAASTLALASLHLAIVQYLEEEFPGAARRIAELSLEHIRAEGNEELAAMAEAMLSARKN